MVASLGVSTHRATMRDVEQMLSERYAAPPAWRRPVTATAVVVVAVVAVGGYWKLALAPKRQEAAQLEQDVAVAQGQLAQTQSLIATYQGAQKEYTANYATLARLGKAVPADDDTRSLMVQLDASAKRSAIDFDTMSLNASGASASYKVKIIAASA